MANKPSMRRPLNVGVYVLLLLLFFLLAYILPLGARDLVVPDETRYGEIPREMIAGGDWVVPHFNGVRYFEKPVLGYWVHAGSILLFGENNFAVRLPSAMAVGLMALLVFALVYPTGRNDRNGGVFPATLAALVFLSCLAVFAVGNIAVLDGLFTFFLTAAITAFYFATEAHRGTGREKLFLLLAGLSCGLAFLTKGFLAFAIPVLVLAPYLIRQRRYSDLLRMSWLPVIVAVLVALPWGLAIQAREPDFWRFFFWHEHIHRFMADNAQHKEPFWFFFLAAPFMIFPWTFLVPAAVSGIKDRMKERGPQIRLMELSFFWLVLPFLFFSFSNGKLLTYILPCFPPFAVLMSFGLLHVLDKGKRDTFIQRGIAASAVFVVSILSLVLYVQVFGYNGLRPYSYPWKTVMLMNGLVFFVLLCAWACRSRKGREKILLFGMAPLLFFLVVHFAIPDPTDEAKSPGALLERYRQYVGDKDVVISDEDTIGAVGWYLRRDDAYVLGGAGELHYGFGYRDAESRLLDMHSAVDLINRNRGSIVVIARTEKHPQWLARLPKPVFQDDSGPDGYAIWKY